MIVVPPERLHKLGRDIFKAQGLSHEKAEFLVETLVEANLTGHDSHGAYYFATYSERIKEGHINVNAEPVVVHETPSTAYIDGKYAPGQITAKMLTEVAVAKAKEHMVSAVGAFNCNHIGRIGYYTNWAAKQGVVALFFVNVGTPAVAVYGGVGKTFGTNPVSVGIPTGDAKPFLMDYATSVVAAGKISVARAKQAKIPLHWTRDKDGKPTDDPFAYKDGGWLLPFGEYKGYALQLVSELLGAVLTGSKVGIDPDRVPPSTNGIFMIAVDPGAFVGLETFREGVDDVIGRVKELKAEPGKRIMIPGEPEWETKDSRLAEGIPLPEETWEEIVSLAGELGLRVEDY
ncbi:Ldh family oxidoreductase [Candidatus Bathyarchaeota archaeon]|nr:Ldh family oxidoreductase [Candidatus Bathyarchaeota archaeon]